MFEQNVQTFNTNDNNCLSFKLKKVIVYKFYFSFSVLTI